MTSGGMTMTTIARNANVRGLFGISFPTIRIAWPCARVAARPSLPAETARRNTLKRSELEQLFRTELSHATASRWSDCVAA